LPGAGDGEGDGCGDGERVVDGSGEALGSGLSVLFGEGLWVSLGLSLPLTGDGLADKEATGDRDALGDANMHVVFREKLPVRPAYPLTAM